MKGTEGCKISFYAKDSLIYSQPQALSHRVHTLVRIWLLSYLPLLMSLAVRYEQSYDNTPIFRRLRPHHPILLAGTISPMTT